jgi:hypothetical protein
MYRRERINHRANNAQLHTNNRTHRNNEIQTRQHTTLHISTSKQSHRPHTSFENNSINVHRHRLSPIWRRDPKLRPSMCIHRPGYRKNFKQVPCPTERPRRILNSKNVKTSKSSCLHSATGSKQRAYYSNSTKSNKTSVHPPCTTLTESTTKAFCLRKRNAHHNSSPHGHPN